MDVFPIRSKFQSKLDKYSWKSLLDTMSNSPAWFTMITNIIYSNTKPHTMVPFILVPIHQQKKINRGRKKGDIHQLINLKLKGKHIIVCYPKYLLIFTAYQVQRWLTMILSTIKLQLDVINVRENLINI